MILKVYNKKTLFTSKLKVLAFNLSSIKKKLLLGKALFFLCLNFYYSVSLYSQTDNIKFAKLNISLSDNNVHAILEDSKGYMWFGSESGLDRFNGTDVTAYSKVIGDKNSLSNNKVLCIFEDSKNNLWIGTAKGLNLYNWDQDVFIQYYFNRDEKRSVLYNNINDIIEDADGTIWLGTKGGVCILEPEKNQFTSFQKFTNSTKQLGNENTLTLIQDKKKRIFAGTFFGNIFKYEKKTGQITEYFFDNGKKELDEGFQVYDIHQTNDGLIWICTTGIGFFKVKKMEAGHIWYENYRHHPENANSLSNDNIECFFTNNNGELWIGTVNGGLNKFDYNKNLFTRYKYNPNEPNSISGNSIWEIFIDSKKRLWFAIFNSGINLVDESKEKFVAYKHNRFINSSLTHSSITAFIEDSIGNMWIASDGGGVDYWNRKTDEFIHYRHNENILGSLGSNAALCFLQTSSGDLWVGNYAGGINILEKGKTEFTHLTTTDGLPSNNIYTIVQGEKNTIYIGTYNGGLSVYNEKTKQFTNYQHNPEDKRSISNNHITVLYFDGDKKLWIGSNDYGLDLLEIDENGKARFTNFNNDPDNPKSLSHNTVLAINEDEKNNLWIGTRGGLNKFNKKTREFKLYNKSDGLPNNTIVGLQKDDNGKLWISSLNGLSRFDPENETVENYDVDDGIQGNKFNNRSSYYTNKKGEMFFGGNDGFTVFHPDSLTYDTNFPNVYFSDFKIFNKEVEIGVKKSPLKYQISETNEITLSHKQSVFTIGYVALNYSHPEKTKYAYKLEGFETDWNYVGTKQTATYTNLDAGEYIFRVKSTNNEGEWSSESTDLIINVTPPFWKTWWFLLIVILAFVLSLVTFYYVRVWQIRARSILLVKLVRQRTLELNTKNKLLSEQSKELLEQKDELVNLNSLKDKFFSIIAHDLRSPFNALMGLTKLLKSKFRTMDDQKKESIIEALSESLSSVYSLIINLLNWSSTQRGEIKISPEKLNLNSLLNENINLVTSQLNAKKIKINTNFESSEFITLFDPDILNTVVRNLLNNAVKFTSESGTIEIGFSTQIKKMLIWIKDDGVGIPTDILSSLFNSNTHITTYGTNNEKGIGLGLIICKEFVEKHGGRLWVESEREKGSTFFFNLSLSY